MTSMNFLTLPYNCVTISFLPEIWFWGPTHPTFLYDVTLFSLFLLKASLSNPWQSLLVVYAKKDNFWTELYMALVFV